MEQRIRKKSTSDVVRGGPASSGIWTDSNGVLKTNSDIAGVSTTRFHLASSAASTTAVGDRAAGLVGSAIVSKEVTITETAGSGVYTGSIAVPAGATILDVIVNGVAAWTNAGTAVLKVGDAGNDAGFFTDVELKSTELLAGESLSFALAGGVAGAYIANSQVSPRYSASARTVSAIATTSSTGGGAGRTRVTVIFSAPIAADITAATKV